MFKAIHEGDPDPKLLAYQYLQMLPQIAQGESNKMWIIPSELTSALGKLGGPPRFGGREEVKLSAGLARSSSVLQEVIARFGFRSERRWPMT